MRFNDLYRSTSLLALSLTALAAPATAQQTAQPESPVEVTPTPTDEETEASPTNLAAENAAAAGGETITVTGSRIRRPDFTTPNPVISVGSDQIEQSGTTNLTDFLTGYPALQGSSTSGDNSGSGAGIGYTGLNLLNLRNLGTDRTLVLVDGRRHVAGVPGSQAIDINTIPSDLVERVDVLTGGASAIYGADGVSGVVNFVLKRNFQGISARAQAGISESGDAGQRLFSITAGQNFLDGKLNVALAYEHGEEDRLTTRDRRGLRGENAVGFFLNPDDPENQAGYTGGPDNGIPDYVPLTNIRYFDTNREGGIDLDFDGFPDVIVDGSGNVVPFDPGTYVPDFYQQGGNATLVSDYGNDLLPRIKRDVVNLITNFQVTDRINLFAEAKFARSKSFSLGQPTFDYYLLIEPDNPFIPVELQDTISENEGALLNRDNFDLGQRGENIDRKTYRGVVGARGDLNANTNFELSYVYGRTDVTNRYVNDILDDRFFAAIDVVTGPNGQPTCRVNVDPNWTPNQPFVQFFPVRDVTGRTTFQPGECVPLNLFGEGVASQAALDFIQVDTTDRSRLEQHVVSGSVAGDFGRFFTFPGGGKLGYAVGAEYRREKSRFTPDPIAAQGLTFTNALAQDVGKFSVKEAFAELRAPLLRELPFANSLEVGAAVRLSDYSTIGNTTAWKIDGSWAPVRDITFTGTYSTAVRAPNIGELFGGRSQTFEFITDPCNNNQIQNGSEFRASNCAELLTALGADPVTFRDPRSTNISGFTGGNEDLLEETAKTWTAGVILQPRFLSGFSARFDYYDIKLEDAINTVAPEEVAQLCVDQATLDNPFCDAIIRQNGGPQAGLITGFNVGPENVSQFRTSGVDANVSYRLRTARAGTFTLNLIGNYLRKLEFIGTPGAPVTDSRGTAFAPKYTVNTDLTWKIDRFTLNYGLNWFAKTARFSNQELEGNPDIVADEYKYYKELWRHDVYGAVNVADKFDFFLGVNNLFNQKRDIGTNTYPVPSIGRYFYAGAKVRLGRTGR